MSTDPTKQTTILPPDTLATALRRLAGADDSTPEGTLRAAVTGSICTMTNGYARANREGSAELRMKHFVRLRSALLALADDIERNGSDAC